MMPISMFIGIILSAPLSKLAFLTQYLIFFMLLISYSKISLKEVRFTSMHGYLLAIQLLGSIIIYAILRIIDPTLAQGVMICILAPTATSAVVITGMLGGNTASLTAYSLLSNFAVALVAPLLFCFLGSNPEISFFDELTQIAGQVFVLLLLPFIITILIDKFSPKLHHKIQSSQSISFVLWNIALIIVTAKTVQFLLIEGRTHLSTAFLLFFFVFIVCVSQFYLGRKLGRRYNDTIAGGQGLGQKNTILSIWMAQTYLNPLASIGPGAYILWQNIINSYQVWKKQHNR